MMPECMPPCPGKGLSITVSIDLGDFLGGPAGPCPLPPPEPCDSDKLIYFNEANRPKESECGGFREARNKLLEKHGDKSSFSGKDEENKEEKEETEEDEQEKNNEKDFPYDKKKES